MRCSSLDKHNQGARSKIPSSHGFAPTTGDLTDASFQGSSLHDSRSGKGDRRSSITAPNQLVPLRGSPCSPHHARHCTAPGTPAARCAYGSCQRSATRGVIQRFRAVGAQPRRTGPGHPHWRKPQGRFTPLSIKHGAHHAAVSGTGLSTGIEEGAARRLRHTSAMSQSIASQDPQIGTGGRRSMRQAWTWTLGNRTQWYSHRRFYLPRSRWASYWMIYSGSNAHTHASSCRGASEASSRAQRPSRSYQHGNADH